MTEETKAKVISIINMKGGVGKTTLCKEIGYFYNKILDKNILFIDLDPQANLTQSFFRKFKFRHPGESRTDNRQIEVTQSIENLLKSVKIEEAAIDNIILPLIKGEKKLDLIPGSLDAVFTERTTKDHLIEKSIYNLIKHYELSDAYDYIFIDCPPTYSPYTVAALLPSDFYLTPVKPDSYSILGIQMMHKVVSDIERTNEIYFEQKPLIPLGVIFTDIPNKPPTGVKQLIREIKDSERLEEKGISFFETSFLRKSDYSKNIAYFGIDSNSDKIKENLSTLIEELEGKVQYE
ncbi:ParA family protein [Listeria monocytogenes]|nr:ParA family protein [Listeria monocytogenes]EJA0931519.1 ParA family protein [Listeria monocytogenes]EJA1053015.1 ParA family protein [Listeria monocytogenes]EJA1074175.1 ParA family protein [Listeria monocytogenes]EJC8830543.1 ParA family protein [Listeria monocytogenes]